MLTHENYILETFALARMGEGTVSPNPLVGAVVVKNGKVIGKGYHQKYGSYHAEVNAISDCSEDVKGATLYCNLEPCCHTNKQTPPCTKLIIEKKIKKVVISNLDPNPHVSGKGVKILQNAGIEVITGVLKEQGEKLNEIFFSYISTGLPFIHLKMAHTLDGRIATSTGDARWISNEYSRKEVHKMRFMYDGVLVGRNTLNSDNPGLDIRMGIESKGKTPYRIILGAPDNLNFNCKILSDEFCDKTIILCSKEAWGRTSAISRDVIGSRNIDLIAYDDLKQAFAELGKRKIASILIEGGGGVFSALINEGLYNKVTCFIAPKLIGNGTNYYKNDEILKVANAIEFKNITYTPIGDQIMMEGYKA